MKRRRKLSEAQARDLRIATDLAYKEWGVRVRDADWEAATVGARLAEAGLTGDDLHVAGKFLAVAWILSLPPRRKPGRPRWPRTLFRSRLAEAIEVTDPPRTTERVAANFRRLDGTTGIDPASLRRLLRKHEAVLPDAE